MNVSFSVAWALVIRTIFNITSNCKHLKTVGHETIGTRFFYSVCVCFAKSFLLLTLILVSKGQWWIRKQQAPRIGAGDGGQKLWSVLQILAKQEGSVTSFQTTDMFQKTVLKSLRYFKLYFGQVFQLFWIGFKSYTRKNLLHREV